MHIRGVGHIWDRSSFSKRPMIFSRFGRRHIHLSELSFKTVCIRRASDGITGERITSTRSAVIVRGSLTVISEREPMRTVSSRMAFDLLKDNFVDKLSAGVYDKRGLHQP